MWAYIFVASGEKYFEFVLFIFSDIGLFMKKKQKGEGAEDMEFPGVSKK